LLSCTGGWSVVPSPSIGNLDNNLAAVSAGSATDAWAVGSYYASNNPTVLQAMGEHFDGTTWTEFPLPNVGPNENSLLGISELSSGHAWAVGYDVNAEFAQQTLVERYNGSSWSVLPTPADPTETVTPYGITGSDREPVRRARALQSSPTRSRDWPRQRPGPPRTSVKGSLTFKRTPSMRSAPSPTSRS